MEHTHIASRFDKDARRIEGLLVEMANLVRTQLKDATTALESQDIALSKRVVGRDREINHLETRIDEFSVRLIALRQPMAEDLRRVVSTLKVSSDLERIGDYAKIMARRVQVIANEEPVESATKTIKRMTKLVLSMLDDAMQAYIDQDAELAEAVRVADDDVDQLNTALFREMLTYMMSNPRNIEASTHLLFIAKNLERAGDRVVNITEQATFLISGEIYEDRDDD